MKLSFNTPKQRQSEGKNIITVRDYNCKLLQVREEEILFLESQDTRIQTFCEQHEHRAYFAENIGHAVPKTEEYGESRRVTYGLLEGPLVYC